MAVLLASCSSGGGSRDLQGDQQEKERLVQDTTERLAADPGGRAMLHAVDAHGGLEAWFRTRSSASIWEYSSASAEGYFTSTLFGDAEGRRTYQELEIFDAAGMKIGSGRFARIGRSGWLKTQGQSTAPRLRHRVAATLHMERAPFVFVLENSAFKLLEPEDLDGAPHDRVAVAGGLSEAHFVVFISQLTGRVSAIRFSFPLQTGDESLRDGVIRYDDFFTVDGLTMPTKMSLYAWKDGREQERSYEAICREITFRDRFDESLLKRPPGAAPLSEPLAAVRSDRRLP